MAKCTYCGTWAGAFKKSHADCEQLDARCKTTEEFQAALANRRKEASLNQQAQFNAQDAVQGASSAAARLPGTQRTIMWGVFKGMWLFTASLMVLGLIFGIVRFVLGV